MCIRRPLASRDAPPPDIADLQLKMRRCLMTLVYSESGTTVCDYARRMCLDCGPGYVSIELDDRDLEAEGCRSECPLIELRYVTASRAKSCLACKRDGLERCHYWEDFDIEKHFVIVACLKTKRGRLVVHQRHPIF